MAKRKRLTPAQPTYFDTEVPALETKSALPAGPGAGRAPIAQVAGDASAAAALQDLAGEVKRARDEGRMIQALPIMDVDAHHLVRDRMMADEDELQVLMASLKARGQQTPIEVVETGKDESGQGRYGLISGWRRLTALRRLAEETGEARFETVQALIRRPETAEAAYTAMVEENEVRVGLTYYERARIAAKAVEQGVFDHERAALQELFASASRAKRSKIGAFLKLYHAADAVLQFPAAIPERLGVALARRFEDAPEEMRTRLREAFAAKHPATADAELAILEGLLKDTSAPSENRPSVSKKPELETDLMPNRHPIQKDHDGSRFVQLGGMIVRMTTGGITVTGARVTPELQADLISWLRQQQRP